MQDGGVSTLVLIGDCEFELRVSSGHVSFPEWTSQPPAELSARISLSLVPRDSTSDATQAARLPVIVTPPATARFQLAIAADDVAASSSTGPLMPLLHSDRSVTYVVEFLPPSTAESDFAWDNFQDHIVVHSKLGKLVVALNATKQKLHDGGERAFHPRTLPAVRAPALKLFDYIARTNAERSDALEAGTAALHRSEMRVSESFNGARRTSTQVLEPLPPVATLGSRPSSRDIDRSGRRAVSPSQPAAVQGEKADAQSTMPPGISSLKEARAVISQLRAQHLTSRRGAATAKAPSISSGVASGGCKDDASPEAHVEAAKRELDAFHSVVATAKQRVASETAAAKSELCYYEQFIPKAAAGKPSTPPQGATLGPSGLSSSSLSSAGLGTSSSNQSKAKKRATGKLPSLGPDSSASAVSKAENNQELSPRKSGTPTQRAATEKASNERKRASLAARRAPDAPRTQLQQPRRVHAASTGAGASSTARQSGWVASARSLDTAKSPRVQVPSKARGMRAPPLQQQAEDESDELSDFDDAEMDAAPELPEELTGVAALEHEQGDVDCEADVYY